MNDRLRHIALLTVLSAPATAWAQSPASQAPAPVQSVELSAGSSRSISSRAAVSQALSTSPALQAAQLNTEAARQQVIAEEGRYPFVWDAAASYDRRVIPQRDRATEDEYTASTGQTAGISTGLRKTFPTGTAAQASVSGIRSWTDPLAGASTGAAVGDTYEVSGRLAVSQPLLRGAGKSVGELELRTARLSEAAAQKTLERSTSELVRDVLSAYWDLWYAGQAVKIEQSALALARRQEEEARIQIAQGALEPAGVLTFSTRVAQLQESLVAAQATERQRALELAQLMGTSSDPSAEFLKANEDPEGLPTPTRAQVEQALQSGSLELAEAEAQVRVARERANVAGESSRPRLDVEGYVETQGVSVKVPRAMERAAKFSYPNAHLGLIFELPLSDSRRDAERAQAWMAVRVAEHNLQAVRDRLAAQASFGMTNEEVARARVTLAEQTLQIAERTAEAERARFELGQVIPIQVQQADEEVRRAQLRLAQARVQLAQTRAALLHLSGQLLARYDVRR